MKRAWGMLVVVAIVGGLGAGAAAQESAGFRLTDAEQALLELTNRERAKRDLPPLRPSPGLCKTARAHAANMARQGKMEHTLDGKTPLDRLHAAGYRFARGGENIAAGDGDVGLPTIMRAWMDSKAHRDNILLADFTEVGLGLGRDDDGQVYYTQVFARPRGDE